MRSAKPPSPTTRSDLSSRIAMAVATAPALSPPLTPGRRAVLLVPVSYLRWCLRLRRQADACSLAAAGGRLSGLPTRDRASGGCDTAVHRPLLIRPHDLDQTVVPLDD